MIERIVNVLLDEGKWLPAAMFLSVVAVVAMVLRQRRRSSSQRLVVIKAMNLFAGSMIGVMATGHLLAITVKTAIGTLEGSLWILYPLGVALTVPAWWLAIVAVFFVQEEERWKSRLLALNIWLGVSLIAVGINNLPLAVPTVLNSAYLLNSNRVAGWAIVIVMVAAMGGLFVGALIFMASGQSFEQFRGME